MNDSLFRTSLVDGTVRRTKVAGDYTVFLKLVGNTVYAAVMNFDWNNESRIMILQADDLAKGFHQGSGPIDTQPFYFIDFRTSLLIILSCFDSLFIADKQIEEHKRLLYEINDFYIEVFYRNEQILLKSSGSLPSNDQLP